MGILEVILKHKVKEIETLKINEKRTRPVRHLNNYFKPHEINIIAEIKLSSPSAGFIKDINVKHAISIYSRYSKGISVLTDKKFFGGGFEFLEEISGITHLPVLCKDFIIDEKQIDKAFACGADIILLIVRILDDKKLKVLYNYAKNKGLDVLVEIHSFEELERIKQLKPSIVGVNSRDLDTLQISLERAKKILKSIDFNCIKIAESGIKNKDNIEYLMDACNGFLIGEALLKSENIEEKFLELL